MVSFSSSTPVSGEDAVLQVVMLPLDLLVPFGMMTGICRIPWYDITTSTTDISKSNAPSIAGASAAAAAAAVFSYASYLYTTQQALHELGTHLVLLLYHTAVVYTSYILHPIAILHLVLHLARYKHLVLHLTRYQHVVLHLAPRTDCTWYIVPHLVPTVFCVSVL